MSDTVNFAGQCGESETVHSASATGLLPNPGLQPNQSVGTVNGKRLDECVIANDDAKVFAIELSRIAGIYDYQLRVEAQGPKGAFSGSMYLGFEDQEGDRYHLRIYDSSRLWHTVSYKSRAPAIITILWSNRSFDRVGDTPNKEKPHYQIVSPVDPAT